MHAVHYHTHIISKKDRCELINQKPFLLWFTGLSGSGKSTIASSIESKLYAHNKLTYLLDGDNVRYRLNKDLGFDTASRKENIRRIGEVCHLFLDSGVIVLSAFISPFREDREIIRTLVGEENFVEIFIDASITTCEIRDQKSLYKEARQGKIKNFTGISAPYEAPLSPHIHIKNDTNTMDESSDIIFRYLIEHKYI